MLPYFDAQKGGGEGGRILYDMGEEDDFDEEEENNLEDEHSDGDDGSEFEVGDEYEANEADPEEAVEEEFDDDLLATGEMESVPFL